MAKTPSFTLQEQDRRKALILAGEEGKYVNSFPSSAPVTVFRDSDPDAAHSSHTEEQQGFSEVIPLPEILEVTDLPADEVGREDTTPDYPSVPDTDPSPGATVTVILETDVADLPIEVVDWAVTPFLILLEPRKGGLKLRPSPHPLKLRFPDGTSYQVEFSGLSTVTRQQGRVLLGFFLYNAQEKDK